MTHRSEAFAGTRAAPEFRDYVPPEPLPHQLRGRGPNRPATVAVGPSKDRLVDEVPAFVAADPTPDEPPTDQPPDDDATEQFDAVAASDPRGKVNMATEDEVDAVVGMVRDALDAWTEKRRALVLEDLDTKRATLARLAEITNPDIAAVLESIEADLRRVAELGQ